MWEESLRCPPLLSLQFLVSQLPLLTKWFLQFRPCCLVLLSLSLLWRFLHFICAGCRENLKLCRMSWWDLVSRWCTALKEPEQLPWNCAVSLRTSFYSILPPVRLVIPTPIFLLRCMSFALLINESANYMMFMSDVMLWYWVFVPYVQFTIHVPVEIPICLVFMKHIQFKAPKL